MRAAAAILPAPPRPGRTHRDRAEVALLSLAWLLLAAVITAAGTAALGLKRRPATAPRRSR